MSAATAQSTESLASPLSRQVASSWLLSAGSPASRLLSPPSAAPVLPSLPPSTWIRTTTRPTSPSPPPPTAIPRPPPRPPPRRRSWMLDRSRSPPSRYLMLGRPPCARKCGRVRTSRSAPPPRHDLQTGRCEVEVELAVPEPCHRRHGGRDSEPAGTQPCVAHFEQGGQLRPEGRRVLTCTVYRVPHGVQPGLFRGGAFRPQPPRRSRHLDVVEPAQRHDQLAHRIQSADRQPGVHRRHRFLGGAPVAHLQVHRDGRGLEGLDRVPRRRCHGGHLLLDVPAALQRGLPVTGADADGGPDVGELGLDLEPRLTADEDLWGGTAHDDLPDGSAEGLWQTPGRLAQGGSGQTDRTTS